MNTKLKVMLVAVPAALLLGLIYSKRTNPTHDQPAPRKILYYQDSMHPWVKSEHADKCSVCGMDLTPVCEGDVALTAGADTVMLNSNSITVLNVQTEEVKAQGMTRTLQVAGTLEADETKKTFVAAPAAGRIDDLMVRYPGVEVKEGERLVTFYSPELTLEKRRFLVRARMSVQKDPTGGLAKPMSDSDPYYSDLISPQAGTVVERRVYKGQYVADGERLFTIVDMSTLWFRFDVYEQQLPWLRLGQTVGVTVSAVPGKVFQAVISFIEPMLNEATRTVKVRADIKNPLMEINGRKQRLLSLGMYAQGDVLAEFQTTLAVPRSAILQPGNSAYAYVEQGRGVYERRRVRLGHQGDGLWEVTQGLKNGERVVVSGNVLLDAQAQFNHPPPQEDSGVEDHTMAAVGGGSSPRLQLNRPAAILPDPEPVAHDMAAGMVMLETPAPADTEPMVANAPVQPDTYRAAARSGFNPRNPSHPATSTAHPDFRNNRLGKYDAAFDAAFNRMAELRTSEIAEASLAQSTNLAKLTEPQRLHLQAMLAAIGELGGSLAQDDLAGFTKHTAGLLESSVVAEKELSPLNPLSGIVSQLNKTVRGPAAKDLTEARSQFLAWGAITAELGRELLKQDTKFPELELKLYHCPMAPAPGLWVQTAGPMRNPFFGAKMQNCGEEVAWSTAPENTNLARLNHDQPAN